MAESTAPADLGSVGTTARRQRAVVLPRRADRRALLIFLTARLRFRIYSGLGVHHHIDGDCPHAGREAEQRQSPHGDGPRRCQDFPA